MIIRSSIVRHWATAAVLFSVWSFGSSPQSVACAQEQRPSVASVRFSGNDHFGDARLKELITQRIGRPLDMPAIRDARATIEALYRDEGYSEVVVTYDVERVPDTGEVLFVIEEGEPVRIRQILFEGNTSIGEKKLKRQIETKTALWIFRSGAFNEDRVEGDIAALQSFYRDRGFLDARVRYRRELSDDGRDLTIVFTVDEGTLYTIEAIEFRGHTVFSREELLGMMASRVSETVKRRQVETDVRTIRTRYGELGHIYVSARAVRVFSDKPGLVRITVNIDEGEQFRVGRVIVRGNARTRDKVVRRALNLFPPDDLFDLTEARETERRLLDTRIFSSARVYPVGDTPGVRDVVIEVVEADRVGDFLFGAGVTSNSGLVGNIVLDLQNFDLFDRPRTWRELTRFRAFFGGGQRFRLELQPGTTLSRFRVDFTEPYLGDKPLRFDLSAYVFDRGREVYTERRTGGMVSFGKRFERGRLRGWTGELAFRAEDASLRDPDIFAAREIHDDEGSHLLTSFKASLVRDRTDSRFVPTSGDRFHFGYEQFGILGGDESFGKITAGYTWYRTLRTDAFDRKSVLQLRAEGGAIIGDAPVFERFYAGGTGTIRGFEFRGVGPHMGLQNNNIGGDFLVLLGGEYSFPLIGESIRGLFFLDSGAVGSGVYRAAIGGGVRFTVDLFGPVPLEFDLAIPVSSDADDEEQFFSFMVGRIF